LLERLYTIKAGAEYLNLSHYTIAAYLSKGLLMRTKVGNRTMIRESELLKLINDGGKSPAPSRPQE
jgi:hypothetical protein